MNPLATQGLRYWDGDHQNPSDHAIYREMLELIGNKDEDYHFQHLALSGGGLDGAFSAGILNAWSDAGNRPEFDVVSGISTGAIVSVFAYLGSDYDEDLRRYYTDTPPAEMFKLNSLFKVFSRNALINTEGFELKVRTAIDADMIERLAHEREKGRLLLIGTTSLDNEKMALWDIGRIAQVGSEDAQTLIQDIVIASSSIPGAFPAKLINIDDGEQQFDELHVDGGVSRQVFLIPQWLRFDSASGHLGQTIYVIRNGSLVPRYQVTENDLGEVSRRSLSTIIRNQGIGDVEFIYFYSQHHGLDFQLAHIGPDFDRDELDPHDLEYMRQLYQYGYDKASDEQLWLTEPPSIMR
ncbi:patatin-like phospholipase family protein [Aliagarivorans marinus]|uniref:patatin-like phospholipase family protein n=1 Tax=Aliagarivorans marinus TaxID=561965 RepID=UPI001FE1EA95|nr:patatin-like phospholipase family protein [Aliagarivorans marinus]